MSTDLCALIDAADSGDSSAGERLFAQLYSELHRVARRELARHGGAMSLGASSLLHEAYIDIAAREGRSFPDRARFLAYASRVMRGLILEHARSRHALKRGGGFHITSLPTDEIGATIDGQELERVSGALDELAKVEPHLAQIVDLKFFCGFSFAEIAALHDVTERTVQRRWDRARIYLHRSLHGDVLS
ncbi:MAG TPA: ECF-type sigma factor [Candidatus Polarisedimenticolia bacterium]|nr:ECF-type sigma factor [Candidatus Polarisedimenticolia bacterium]